MIFKRTESVEVVEAGLEDVLRNFRSSVHAWSQAEFTRPRAIVLAQHHRIWRSATAWALGCVLASGSMSIGLYQHQHREQLARIAAQRAAQERQMAAAQAAAQRIEDGKLMAAVDKDVSQEVPSAMEPLAQLMDEGANQ